MISLADNELVATDEKSPTLIDKKHLDLDQLAQLAMVDEDISSALSDNTVDNMKKFLVIYSRSQLNRVVRLNAVLQTLEDDLMTRALTGECNTDQLMNVIRLISKSLENAINLVKQVTTDESYLQVIVNNSKIINNTLNYNNINGVRDFSKIANQESREKVRTAIQTILQKVDSLDNTIDV